MSPSLDDCLLRLVRGVKDELVCLVHPVVGLLVLGTRE